MLLLTLRAGTNRYAIDVTRVVELAPRVELRSIPHAPVFLAGLLSYRGRVIPVIDLGLLMGGSSCSDCLSTRIILVNDASDDLSHGDDADDESIDRDRRMQSDSMPDSTLLGLIGEHVSDLTSVRPETIVASPIQLEQVPFLNSIVQTKDGILQLITVERIRETLRRGHILNKGIASDPDLVKEEAWKSAIEDLKIESELPRSES
jgi:chemotaxis-related protein WspB